MWNRKGIRWKSRLCNDGIVEKHRQSRRASLQMKTYYEKRSLRISANVYQ
jgi:hypothetical protein